MSTFPETAYPQVDQQPQKSWWGRNWKVVVPVGCGGCLIFVVGGIAIAVWVAFAAFGFLKESEPYKAAVAKAKASPAVQAAIGAPIEESGVVIGEVEVNEASGRADLVIPLVGPKGAAVVEAAAEKRNGEWTFSRLTVEVPETGEKIDLLQEPVEVEIEEGGEKGDEPGRGA